MAFLFMVGGNDLMNVCTFSSAKSAFLKKYARMEILKHGDHSKIERNNFFSHTPSNLCK